MAFHKDDYISVFPLFFGAIHDAAIKGCLFHFTQAVFRKIQSVGLHTGYTKDSGTYLLCRNLMALALLSCEYIAAVYDGLKGNTDEHPPAIRELLAYFEGTCTTPFYLLVKLLHTEAQSVQISMQLVSREELHRQHIYAAILAFCGRTRYTAEIVIPHSTYCSNLFKHCENIHRVVHVVNLDPAAEYFDYPVMADIRELIDLEDAMSDEHLHFGPNGGLVFCMEYLQMNMDWLQEQLDDVEDDYILFDCPGQIELYTHIPVMKMLVETLQKWNFNVCGVFILDSQFMISASKFVSGILTALAAMVNLEIPHVNVMSKLDLLSKKDKKEIERYLEPDLLSMIHEEFDDSKFNKKFKKLNSAMASMVEDYSLVKFLPLDASDDDSLNDILMQIDMAIQFGEDAEPREIREREDDPDAAGDSGFDG
ncbi:hypothetical protein ScPMuIL_006473 [Solemya velum]